MAAIEGRPLFVDNQDDNTLTQAIKAHLEPRREENELRAAWSLDLASAEERSRQLVEAVERIGAEPFEPPEPLPPILHDDIELICWLAIEREKTDRPEE